MGQSEEAVFVGATASMKAKCDCDSGKIGAITATLRLAFYRGRLRVLHIHPAKTAGEPTKKSRLQSSWEMAGMGRSQF